MIGELEIYETDSYSSAHVVLIRAIEQKLAFVTQQEVFITNQFNVYVKQKMCSNASFLFFTRGIGY